MTSRERLLHILRRQPADRAAVLCPGGMMSMAVTDLMTAETAWPRSHYDESAMVALVTTMQQTSGFDSAALPFCMTVECEAYGAEIDFGTRTTQPRVKAPILSADGTGKLKTPEWTAGRAAMILRAMRRVRAALPDVALLGNLNGPFSILGELVEIRQALKWTRRRPDLLRDYLAPMTDHLIQFGRLQIEAGADAICIAEPSATGEILGGQLFRSFAAPPLNALTQALQAAGVPVIVHICGDVRPIETVLFDLAADAVSFDCTVNLADLIARRPPWLAMGNLSPILLESGPAEAIAQQCRRIVSGGAQLVAPACGIIPTTPAAHLRAMRDSVDKN